MRLPAKFVGIQWTILSIRASIGKCFAGPGSRHSMHGWLVTMVGW
jgi:hypothetical protein